MKLIKESNTTLVQPTDDGPPTFYRGFGDYKKWSKKWIDDMYAGTGWWGYVQPLETNIRFLKYAKHFKVLNKVFWGTDNYDPRIDVALVKSLPEKSKEYNLFPTLPEINDEDIKNYLGNNAAKLMGI